MQRTNYLWEFSKQKLNTISEETNSKRSATNSTNKCNIQIIYGILKTKIEHHIRYIKEESEVQAGFTKNRRISDNLLVLDYCVKESFKRKKPLYLISIDFQKAFDSIKRVTLIYALKNTEYTL